MKYYSLLFPLAVLTLPARAQTNITWSNTVDVAASSFDNKHPRLAAGAMGQPFVLWGRASAERVYFARGLANGGFDAPVILNPAGVPVFAASWAGPDLAAHGDTVYAVFKKKPEHESHAYLVYSYDGGATFSEPVRVDDASTGISRFPTVSTDAQAQPVVGFMKFESDFSDARYVVVRSADYGLTFSAEVLASGNSAGDVCDCCPGAVVVAGDTVAMLYRNNDANIRNTWAGISTDGGASFPAGLAVDDLEWEIGGCPSTGPDGVIIGDTLYSVFMNAFSGTSRCYLSRTELTGLLAGPGELLPASPNPAAQQNYPRIARHGKAVAIVLIYGVGNTRQIGLYFTRDITDGAPLAYQSVATGSIENVDVAMTADAVHVVWENTASGTVQYRSGVYCDNVESGGLICCDQTICPGDSLQLLAETQAATGGTGALEYRWLMLDPGPQNPTNSWVVVPGATGPALLPALPIAATDTLFFQREVRRTGCNSLLASNLVRIEALPAGDPACLSSGAGDVAADAITGVTPGLFAGHLTVRAANGGYLRIADAAGHTWFDARVEAAAGIRVTTEHWPPGVYFWLIREPSGQLVRGKLAKP